MKSARRPSAEGCPSRLLGPDHRRTSIQSACSGFSGANAVSRLAECSAATESLPPPQAANAESRRITRPQESARHRLVSSPLRADFLVAKHSSSPPSSGCLVIVSRSAPSSGSPKVVCWGSNTYGRLGIGNGRDASARVSRRRPSCTLRLCRRLSHLRGADCHAEVKALELSRLVNSGCGALRRQLRVAVLHGDSAFARARRGARAGLNSMRIVSAGKVARREGDDARRLHSWRC